MSIRNLIDEWGALQKAFAVLAAVVTLTLVLNGVVQFLKDAPAIVDSNARHVTLHHDSIGGLYQAVEAQGTVAQHVEEHLATEDSANRERDRKLDYLVCIRIERKRELDSLPALSDCDADLLNR